MNTDSVNKAVYGSGGSKGDTGTPLGGPNSFNFMQFLRKFGKIVCWCHPPESWRPLLGEILVPPLYGFAGSNKNAFPSKVERGGYLLLKF